MASLIRRSILKRFLITLCWLSVCASASLALAQQSAARTGGGVVHTSAPPILRTPLSPAPIHAPVFQPPVVRTPMIHAPMIPSSLSAHRISEASPAARFGTPGFRPIRRPVRPFPPVLVIYQPIFVFGGPFWGLNACWWATCNPLWLGTLDYTTVSSPGPANYVPQVYETPVFAYGEERADVPQLFLKDGTILNVTDYWLVDDQLHFLMADQDGAKPTEHVMPFEALDLQTTVDTNTRRGFRFILRNEPFEQYLRDHPEGAPPVVALPRE